MAERRGQTTQMLREVLAELRSTQEGTVVILVQSSYMRDFTRSMFMELGATGPETHRVRWVSIYDRPEAQRGRRFQKIFVDHSVYDCPSEQWGHMLAVLNEGVHQRPVIPLPPALTAWQRLMSDDYVIVA